MMEILATVLGVCFLALVMLSLCRAGGRAEARGQHDWRGFGDGNCLLYTFPGPRN